MRRRSWSSRHQVGRHQEGQRSPGRSDLRVAAGVPQQVSHLRHLMRGVKLPSGEVILHVLGQAAEKQAKKQRSCGLVLWQPREH